MPDYKQTEIAGQSYNRFSRVVIDNPLNAGPSVLCVEQEVISLGASEVVRDIGNLNFPFDMNAEFDILDPFTNVATGQKTTGAQVYVLVRSLVMTQAHARDAAMAAAVVAAALAANPPAQPAP